MCDAGIKAERDVRRAVRGVGVWCEHPLQAARHIVVATLASSQTSTVRSPSRHDERQPDDDQGHTDTRDKPMHEEWRVGDAVKEVTGGHDEVA